MLTSPHARIRSESETHFLPALSCVLVALLISLLPYYLWGRNSKGLPFVFIHDPDNVVYL